MCIIFGKYRIIYSTFVATAVGSLLGWCAQIPRSGIGGFRALRIPRHCEKEARNGGKKSKAGHLK